MPSWDDFLLFIVGSLNMFSLPLWAHDLFLDGGCAVLVLGGFEEAMGQRRRFRDWKAAMEEHPQTFRH
jgi:hypothetical protein